MNFKHIHTEENINNFIFLENELIFQKEDSVYNFSKKNSVINKLKYKHIFFDSNFIYSHPILYTKEGVIVREFTDDQAFIFFINPIKDYVISIKSKTNFKERAYSIFLNDNLIRNLPFKEYFILKKYFIKNKVFLLSSDNSIIYFYDIFNSNEDCQYDLETYFHQPAQIMEGRVLVSNNKIIFFAHTEDWSDYATFILDAQTGQVLNNPKETIFGGKMYLFDGFLWQKKDKGFAKMNPETFEITHYDLTKDLPTEIIDNRTMAYHNGIIAVSTKPERDSIRSLVLLFDTNTGKIIWRKEILHNESKPSNNENRRQIEEIQMNDKYLAVSTTGFSLYIFENQDVESK